MGSDENHFNVSVGSAGQSHKPDSVHKPQPFWWERRAEAVSNRGPSAYQPNAALPLGQTGSQEKENASSSFIPFLSVFVAASVKFWLAVFLFLSPVSVTVLAGRRHQWLCPAVVLCCRWVGVTTQCVSASLQVGVSVSAAGMPVCTYVSHGVCPTVLPTVGVSVTAYTDALAVLAPCVFSAETHRFWICWN